MDGTLHVQLNDICDWQGEGIELHDLNVLISGATYKHEKELKVIMMLSHQI